MANRLQGIIVTPKFLIDPKKGAVFIHIGEGFTPLWDTISKQFDFFAIEINT